jgi:hypothetical protein
MDAHEAPAESAPAEPLGAFVVVAFIEPTPVGVFFSKRRWPLHVTLLRFDAPRGAALGAIGRALAPHHEPIIIRVMNDADFGFRGRVRVSLVDREPNLQAMHERVLREVVAVGGHVHSPQHTGRGFRPHVTVQGERRVHEGDRVVLDDFALIDMAPDGNTSLRLPLAAWGRGAL